MTRLYWQQEWPMLSYSIYVVCSLYVMFLLPPERAPKVLAPSLLQLVIEASCIHPVGRSVSPVAIGDPQPRKGVLWVSRVCTYISL